MKNTKKYKRVMRDINSLKEEIAKVSGQAASSRSRAPIGVIRKAASVKKKAAGVKINVNDAVSGILRGVEKATGKNYAADVLQHVTTPQECSQWMRTIKAMLTDDEGNLDKKEYCNILNKVRDDTLFTVSELKKAIDDAKRAGNTQPVPGYETMIEQYQTNAGILEKEIKVNGGTVNN